MNTLLESSNLPVYSSPANQDVEFVPGLVRTRPGLTPQFSAIAGNPTGNYLKTYVQPNLQQLLLAFDSLGVLWGEVVTGTLTNISSPYFITHSSYANSATQFGREYLGIGDGRFGIDIPRQYDGTYLDKISQEGPGAPPTAADSGGSGDISAGAHRVVVLFVTRQGYFTRPSPYYEWTASGSDSVDLTDIPTGPTNVVARIIAFTAAGGASYYYTAGTNGLPNMVIGDNTTTAATMNFTDTQLLSGTNIDDLFRLIELGEVSGVSTYANRMIYTGERNRLQNLLNMSFDGGFDTGGGKPASVTLSATSGFSTGFSTGDPASWQNVANVIPTAAAYATIQMVSRSEPDEAAVSPWIYARLGGTGLLPTDIVTGIQVTVDVEADGYNPESNSFGAIGISDGVDNGFSLPIVRGVNGVSQVYTAILGGPNQLWGFSSISVANLNGAEFSFKYMSSDGSFGNTTLSGIKDVRFTIYYLTGPFSTLAPLGWTLDPTSGDGGGRITSMIFGDAYQITGDGSTAIRGLIAQSAYQDQLGVPIIEPAIGYSVRVRVRSFGTLMQGTLHINLQSTSLGLLTTGIAVDASQVDSTWREFIAVLTDPLNSVPTDLLLQVYADDTPTVDSGFILDNIEIYPTLQPYLATIAHVSFPDDPESIDGITGNISVAPENGQAIVSTFVLRDFLYFVKQRSLYVTSDVSESEPSTWTVREVSSTVGSPSVRGTGLGDEWAVIAGQNGVYLFGGGEPSPISDEIRPTWEQINWTYGYLLGTRVDTKRKRIYIAAPYGTSTTNNVMFVLDYTEGFGDPLGNGGVGRKWTIWNIPSGSMALVEKNGIQELLIGNGAGNGLIYLLDDDADSDNGTAINAYWQSGYAVSATRALWGYISANLTGEGVASLLAYTGDQERVRELRGWTLNLSGSNNLERQVQVQRERFACRIGTNEVGHHFSLQGLYLWARPATPQLIRGRN